MKKLLILIAIIFISKSFFGQSDYKNSIGLSLRGSGFFGVGVNYKTQLNEMNYLDIRGFFNFKSDDTYINLSGSYLFHKDDFYNDFYWYYGLGADMIMVKYKDSSLSDNSDNMFGIHGTFGAEYQFDEPFVISLDITPTYYLKKNVGVDVFNVAFSVRYIF